MENNELIKWLNNIKNNVINEGVLYIKNLRLKTKFNIFDLSNFKNINEKILYFFFHSLIYFIGFSFFFFIKSIATNIIPNAPIQISTVFIPHTILTIFPLYISTHIIDIAMDIIADIVIPIAIHLTISLNSSLIFFICITYLIF